ncbi:MAG: rRNA maturation RNase YbeY [Rickettsiales bacterium]|jgi:probable rRNA maturation factor|nr:rRNA maturation RNase YbeY [Rickettsiales bacterium]
MMKIQIILEDRRWSRFIRIPRIRAIAEELFSLVGELLGYGVAEGGANLEIAMVLSNDEKIRVLNRDHRNIDRPTNVLSFPTYEREFVKYLGQEKHMLLGDLVLSIDSLERESIEQNMFFEEHLAHLILHSILHLLGFDHSNDEDAEHMEKTEAVILHRFMVTQTNLKSDLWN